MVDVNVSNDLLQAAAERANQEQRSVIEVINTLMRDYAEGRTWLNLPAGEQSAGAPDRWWITTGPLPAGGEKVLGPFCSQELALKVRTYLEFATQSAGRTYWVDDEPPAPAAAGTEPAGA
jgi:hypothetical protein